MRYNRNEPFRYEFVEPIDCQFTIIEVNHEKVTSSNANAKIIDLSQSGMKMETELDIPTNNVRVILEVTFVIVKEKYEIPCEIIWSRLVGKEYQYGLKFDAQDEFAENVIKDMKVHAKHHRE